jgi:hypothetical protein
VDAPATLCGSGRAPGRTNATKDMCVACAIGSYKMLADNSSCVSCPSHASTRHDTSFLLAECTCVAGHTPKPQTLNPRP